MTAYERTTLDHHSRSQVEAERRDRILALPQWTLIRLGWEVQPGRVQGGIFYRIGDGLGPTSRDHSAVEVLRDEVQRSHMPYAHQHWGIEVLAEPS